MSVRRLAEVQPEGFSPNRETKAFAKAVVKKYPAGKRASAVIPLLWKVQEQHEGWVSDTIGLHDNYREVKIKAPNLDPVFVRPAHFPDANILVFTRVTDRGLNAGAMRDTGR